ncbi:MAG: TIGR03663 family protein [Anaerolineales bacterium]|jgi:predicted membrane-bound mannosyltransferase/DNA-binding beta-propeller fold protein YncE
MESIEINHWLDRKIHTIKYNWETILFSLLILVAIATRFYNLDARVMSHDESLHTYYSWTYSKGQGFQHNPLMHGPLQFHLLAMIFSIFGDNDFTARIPAALASIFSIGIIWKYRRYLGRSGAVITAGLFVISPYMLYYGRYIRNEAFVVLFGLISLWALLRYLDTGRTLYIYYLITATALHFTTKETSFIYLAQTLLFLGLLFLNHITQHPWQSKHYRTAFISILVIVLFVAATGFGYILLERARAVLNPDNIVQPLIPGDLDYQIVESQGLTSLGNTIIMGGVIVLCLSLYFVFKGYGIENLRNLHSFNLIILLGSIALPHLSAFLIRMLGWDPLNYQNTQNLEQTGIVVIILFIVSIIIGLWWKPKIWLIANSIFYGIYLFFFTSLFTNNTGFFTGLVGSLGYWLVQQGVERGNQPLYYYALVQIPLYEYLAALGTLLAAGIGWRVYSQNKKKINQKSMLNSSNTHLEVSGNQRRAILLFGFWAVSSLFAYTIAGEKMPWLTVHIALPMLLLTGWALGYIVDRVKWSELKKNKRWTALIIIPILIISLAVIIISLINPIHPFSGKTIDQLEATNHFLLSLIVLSVCLWGLFKLSRMWDLSQINKLSVLTLFTLLGVLTTRTAFTAAFIDYNRATEPLVYAHGADGVKVVMNRIEDISQRSTDGLALKVAYDSDVEWPFKWYLRNYTNQQPFGDEPYNELRDVPIILIGDDIFHKIDPIVGDGYDRFDYIRMWWPIQDYFGLNWEKMKTYIADESLRWGIFQIWMNRDYSAYGEAVARKINLTNWNPSDRMRMYIRKDTIADLWDYGVGAYEETIVIDPYENGQIQLHPDNELQIGEDGNLLFNSPRDIAVGIDGSLYITDSKNHRIVHVKDGEVVNTWGELSVSNNNIAPNGTFNEPWGIAVSPDGNYIYVADTWNHRVQKFSSDGEFIKTWGFFGQTGDPFELWGPRDVATDPDGNVYVSDTGNKRIQVFSPQGEFLREFGGAGFAPGQFDEPVGIAIDPESGIVFIADTWNQRIQSFSQSESGNDIPEINWEISAWYGQSLDNKPYLAIGPDGNVFATDPEISRILVFNQEGEFLYFFGDFETSNLGVPNGITSDNENGIWISDSKNNRLLHFTLP